MKIALISDIHGNLEAFRAVLSDMQTLDIDQTVCLGDCVGYGPDPEAVMAEIRQRNIPSIMGNHELAVCNRQQLNWFNTLARQSIEKTIAMLSEVSLEMIKQLPYFHLIAGSRCVHGYPPDSAKTYLFQKLPYQLIKTFTEMDERICFVGHTHDLEIIDFDGRQVERHPLGKGVVALNTNHRYIVNIGSVGQPRDGSNHAKYAIYDPDNRLLEIRYVTYDIAVTVNKIKAAGLPEAHANRLW